jgi:hypothetical protein
MSKKPICRIVTAVRREPSASQRSRQAEPRGPSPTQVTERTRQPWRSHDVLTVPGPASIGVRNEGSPVVRARHCTTLLPDHSTGRTRHRTAVRSGVTGGRRSRPQVWCSGMKMCSEHWVGASGGVASVLGRSGTGASGGRGRAGRFGRWAWSPCLFGGRPCDLPGLCCERVVRHEASMTEWSERSNGGPWQRVAEAGGGLAVEAQGWGESSPDNDGTGRCCRTAGVRRARREGVARANQWLNPLKRGSGSNRVDVGRGAVHACPNRVGDSGVGISWLARRP